MDSTATNYDSAATSQTGVTCTYATVSPPSGGGGGGGGGGGSGGGGTPAPTIVLAALPHVLSQPLVYLYLSQIPYTGLDLGPVGTVLYWTALVGWALALAYLILFGAVPVVNRRVRSFGSRVGAALNARELAPVAVPIHNATPAVHAVPEAPRGYSSYDGFKSYARGGALSVDDIVKGLSRKHHVAAGGHQAKSKPNTEPVYEHIEPVYENVEPVYDHIEPVYKNVETIVTDTVVETGAVAPHIRGLISALVEGDRVAVFAGLREHVRAAGAPERLLSSAVCLLDDAYRARVDGTSCDEHVARLTAKIPTPTLEKLVASLATAVDSSYSEGVIGAKLALTRALLVLGA